MKESTNSIFVGAQIVMKDCDVSRTKAYKIIRQLNADLKKAHPAALIIPGKVNRSYYEYACNAKIK